MKKPPLMSGQRRPLRKNATVRRSCRSCTAEVNRGLQQSADLSPRPLLVGRSGVKRGAPGIRGAVMCPLIGASEGLATGCVGHAGIKTVVMVCRIHSAFFIGGRE
jgi:hypothetical protein